MSQHPYQSIPKTSHWRKAFQGTTPSDVDLVCNFRFNLGRNDKVATAGSCFAQHIARHLAKSGFNFYVTETGHPIGTPDIREKFNYGVFSARYGNIYTSRQLVQLFDRAFGTFSPAETCWQNAHGKYVDPYRPTVHGDGFSSKEEMLADRIQHLGAVREMFQNLDFFIFTLGLTECWISAEDSAVFPICPGISGGTFDAQKHVFHNLSVAEVIDDLREFRTKLLMVNPHARIILTVSPVPLMATMEARHVQVSTTASKAILRVAADQMEREFSNVTYFPSYEIITSSFSRGTYFGPDLRSVTETGVSHVMRLFLKHATSQQDDHTAPQPECASPSTGDIFAQNAEEIVKVICDEDLLL